MKYRRLHQRLTTLQHCLSFIRRLEQRIQYSAVPLETVIIELKECEEFGAFPLLPSEISQPEFREMWLALIREKGDQYGLTKDDVLVMNGFVSQIGKSDVMGQLRLCEEYAAVLESHCLVAREEVKTKGRLCMTLGVCGGFTAAVLFV